jgi:YidC/Oxa1 family membrane protein insertase
MGFDRNTVIGFVLLGVLLFVYLFTSTKNSQALQRRDDSIARVKQHQEELARIGDTAKNKPANRPDTATGFNKALGGTEEFTTLENDLVKIVFSNKGGQPASVELKNYKSYDSTPVQLVSPGTNNRLSYPINTTPNQPAQVGDLYFEAAQVTRNPDGSQTLSYRLPAPDGESITHRFTLRPHDYLVDWDVSVTGADKLFSTGNFNFSWQAYIHRDQKNVSNERRLAGVCFYEDNAFDYMQTKTERTFDKPVQWLSVSNQFFNTTLIAKQNFNSGVVHLAKETDTSSGIARTDASLQAKIPAASSAVLSFQLYYGPNEFSILEKQAPGMTRIIDLGRGVYSFVRPINVYIIRPVFGFFKQFISSYGLCILLLTLFIRLVTSPLVYSSYLSGAKMKALRPEIEAMKKRVGNDQQQVGVEQMKLFREAGVNPLGGCIPALLQIPIFFALYSFFNSNIALRGQHFLWSPDLSSYDSIINFGFSIPLIGWDHISLFALTAVVTSFLISLYGMSMTPDQSNPAMKYMPYIMPVFLLVFFNNLASALTWYYTVSNLITLMLQFVIQNYIIDHDKILAKLQENRTKPKSKSKWQERLEQMQEAQKQAQQRQTPKGRK